METLKREIREEISAEVIECGSIGYLRERNIATNEIKYFYDIGRLFVCSMSKLMILMMKNENDLFFLLAKR